MENAAEAGGLKARLLAEAEAAKAVLAGKAKGFEDIIKACQSPEGAQNLLVTELLPQLVRE
ncbi:MAG: flotillin family protein, partial [Chthoniobacterales bacterium]